MDRSRRQDEEFSLRLFYLLCSRLLRIFDNRTSSQISHKIYDEKFKTASDNMNFNTLAFIRYYFHIPESRRLSWALIEETSQSGTEIRLGVVFPEHPHLYIDVAMRRFFTVTTMYGGAFSRKVTPARRTASRDSFVYSTDSGLTLRTPKNFISDIYFSSLYCRDLFRQRLL